MGSSEDTPQAVHFGVMSFAEDRIKSCPKAGSVQTTTVEAAGAFSVFHWCPFSLCKELEYP